MWLTNSGDFILKEKRFKHFVIFLVYLYQDPNLVDTILQQLNEHNLQPKDINIELTERVLFTEIKDQNNSLRRLVENDINISIDDFGTGFSSLAYLHNIPATTVKVDKSFLESINNNTVTRECINRIVSTLGMKSLIEGIETEEHANILFSLGFNIQQGYFHGRPKPLAHYVKSVKCTALKEDSFINWLL